MIEVVSIRFKNNGKCYYFDPASMSIHSGDKVIVETSKGLEIAECARGNHPVEDTLVIQPLRPVVRIATADDMKVAENNVQREKEAFEICQKKIAEHNLDMKLVDVECNFEGSKTLFFFTSDGRVDFRDLVKDLAGIFHNRIELRQIGVRDEAKMLGGIGICGRPYCCSQFLADFQPVSTKMAKVQSLSLNPTKISGSCGRLMCCLRYEQDAYEDLLRSVPKQGAYVQTKDGCGTAVQVNLLRQTVKVKLDKDGDDSLHLYGADELSSVPGGRPKDGIEPPPVPSQVTEPEASEQEDEQWSSLIVYSSASSENDLQPDTINEPEEKAEALERRSRPHRQKDYRQGVKNAPPEDSEAQPRPRAGQKKKKPESVHPKDTHPQGSPRYADKTAVVKPVRASETAKAPSENTVPEKKGLSSPDTPEVKAKAAKKPNHSNHYYHGKPKSKSISKD